MLHLPRYTTLLSNRAMIRDQIPGLSSPSFSRRPWLAANRAVPFPPASLQRPIADEQREISRTCAASTSFTCNRLCPSTL
jgi:hypothetical protein